MTLLEDLAAAKAQLALDEAALIAAETLVTDTRLALSQASVEALKLGDAVDADNVQIAAIQAQIDAQAPIQAPWLGVWPHGPDYPTWKQVRTFAPKVKAYRWRGDGQGRFDFAFSKLTDLAELARGGFFVAGNFNLRHGMSPHKTAVKLLDVAAGKYDADIIAAARVLVPFKGGCCEIASEINIQHGPTASQPSFPDWSLPNWEKAFVHVAQLFRANGVTIPLGTSIAGPSQMAKWKTWTTPGIIAESDFIGFDFYKRSTAANWPSVALPVAVKAAKEMGLPLIICENGVNKGLGLGTQYFGQLLAEVKKAPPGAIAGVVCTNGDHPDGPYWLDAPSPDHGAFVNFASDAIWL